MTGVSRPSPVFTTSNETVNTTSSSYTAALPELWALELITEGVLMLQEGRIRFVNSVVETLTQTSRHKLIGSFRFRVLLWCVSLW